MQNDKPAFIKAHVATDDNSTHKWHSRRVLTKPEETQFQKSPSVSSSHFSLSLSLSRSLSLIHTHTHTHTRTYRYSHQRYASTPLTLTACQTVDRSERAHLAINPACQSGGSEFTIGGNNNRDTELVPDLPCGQY